MFHPQQRPPGAHQTLSVHHRNLPRNASVLVVGLVLALLGVAQASAERHPGHGGSVVLDTTLDMLCFPPTANQPPPCQVPVGIDPDLVAPDPSGEMRIRVRDDDTATLSIRLDGLSPHQVATAWFVHFPPGQAPPHPIFAPIGPGEPSIAHMDSPVAHTRAAFTEGMGFEPNQIRILPNGKGRLIARLDYNPLKSGQVPLVNGMVLPNQGPAPEGFGVEQGECCVDFPAGPQREPIGGSYLRRFDDVTGFQVLDDDGYPEIVRSPARPVVVAIVVHIDGVTSGIVPGIPTPPFLVDPPVTTGSFYLLGLFPLVNLGMD